MMHYMKIVLVGSSAVGKTCLLTVFAHRHFSLEYVPTVFGHHRFPVASINVAFDNVKSEVIVDGHRASLSLEDTAGSENYDYLRSLPYPQTDFVLICYSVVDPRSFADIKTRWLPEVRRYLPYVSIMLVGTKSDLRDDAEYIQRLREENQQPVTWKQGRRMVTAIDACAFHECSAITDIGITEIFEDAVRMTARPLPYKPARICPATFFAPEHCDLSVTYSPLEALPPTAKKEVIDNLDEDGRLSLAATSRNMELDCFIHSFPRELTHEQLAHLRSWRVRALMMNSHCNNYARNEILCRAVESSTCPEEATPMQREAVANGATWEEVENEDITRAHIVALCNPENQMRIVTGKMIMHSLFRRACSNDFFAQYPDPFPFNDLPPDLQDKIIRQLLCMEESGETTGVLRMFGFSSKVMLIKDMIACSDSECAEHNVPLLTNIQRRHLLSWRIKNKSTDSICEALKQVANCPYDANFMQREAVANGATWEEVAHMEITEAHIEALRDPENQRDVIEGRTTVDALLTTVTFRQLPLAFV